ncbi:Barrier-to-autointegration factor [Characodon lateralis]|uniref:Barrier-to-autointegration factor n=1 Tax=Characodon lateralis TaxID=208331 RepID=A0ABU7CXM8_9TELE|nr:Barrier-to-autointegration factor [Characodon lateralis]
MLQLILWISDKTMSSTSKKHGAFVAEPMGEKRVTALPGIGKILGGRMEESGFDKANVVLGQFLVLKKDEELFDNWLKDTCGANAKQQRDCYGCLREWCDDFL